MDKLQIKKEIAEYLSDYAIKDLRATRLNADPLLRGLNETPNIDALRNRIRDSDIGWLQRMAQDEREAMSALGISLLRPVQHAPQVRQFLFSLWQKDTGYHRRWWVMFRLLDYSDLPMAFHVELFQFTKNNWEAWLADQIAFFDGAENLLKVLDARLKDLSWPQSRTWERVLSSLGASDDEFLAEFLAWIGANRLEAPLVKEALAFAAEKRLGCVRNS